MYIPCSAEIPEFIFIVTVYFWPDVLVSIYGRGPIFKENYGVKIIQVVHRWFLTHYNLGGGNLPCVHPEQI